nr:SRPBCC family protein [Kibdelosporangium sp. MJ126-NF4]CEL18476.1 cyclase/dehydrase [Kibdelosporangium sp. MJ126-NF4]CTQ97960.1 cyclase/dehydrase [Kibdelosporangium sp. MJ126-NF4]
MDETGPRYADCPSVAAEVIVDADVAAVWPLVCDIALPTSFSAELRAVRWLDDVTEPRVGARFQGTNEHPAIGRWHTVCTITEFVPGQRITYVVQDVGNPAATWRFEVEPSGGGTQLRQWARIGPGPSLLNRVINANPHHERQIVADRLENLRTNMIATVTGIKERAERR